MINRVVLPGQHPSSSSEDLPTFSFAEKFPSKMFDSSLKLGDGLIVGCTLDGEATGNFLFPPSAPSKHPEGVIRYERSLCRKILAMPGPLRKLLNRKVLVLLKVQQTIKSPAGGIPYRRTEITWTETAIVGKSQFYFIQV